MNEDAKTKIFGIIGAFCILIEKDKQFPNIAPYDVNIINQSFQEIEKISKKAIMEMVKRLDWLKYSCNY